MGKAKKIKRTKLSDSQLKSEILALFSEGKTGKTDLFGLIRTKFSLGRDRYFKMYDSCYPEWAKLKAKGESEAIVSGAVEALKSGLKSKLERLMFYQSEVEVMEKQLRGELKSSFSIGNFLQTSHVRKVFMLPVQVQNQLREQIRAYQVEISKIEGDYAETAFRIRGDKDNPLQIQNTLNDTQFQQLLTAARESKTTSGK